MCSDKIVERKMVQGMCAKTIGKYVCSSQTINTTDTNNEGKKKNNEEGFLRQLC